MDSSSCASSGVRQHLRTAFLQASEAQMRVCDETIARMFAQVHACAGEVDEVLQERMQYLRALENVTVRMQQQHESVVKLMAPFLGLDRTHLLTHMFSHSRPATAAPASHALGAEHMQSEEEAMAKCDEEAPLAHDEGDEL